MTESILRVTAKASQEITASLAKLHFAVEGETFLFGNAALDRSKILKDLVTKLKELGATDADFNVKSVSARIDSGLLGKNSKAEFKLELTVSDFSKLPDFLGVIVIAKNVQLEQLEWMFETDAVMLELSAAAMKKAFDKAQAMANAVGHRVLGIRSASDSSKMPEMTQNLLFSGGDWMSQEMERNVSKSRVGIGTEFNATREVESAVTVDFYLEKPATV